MSVAIVLLSATAQAGFISVSGAAIQEDGGTGVQFTRLVNGAAVNAVTGNSYGFAPLSLPDGAAIRNLVCTLQDSDATGQVAVRLYTSDANATDVSFTSLATVDTAAAVDSDYHRVFASLDTTVDNRNATYFLRVDYFGAQAANTLAVQGCTIRTVP